jgi:hypothetical protein
VIRLAKFPMGSVHHQPQLRAVPLRQKQ